MLFRSAVGQSQETGGPAFAFDRASLATLSLIRVAMRVVANVGDTVTFAFEHAGTWQVLQGTNISACAPSGTFDSQPQTAVNGGTATAVFQVTNATEPVYFYDPTYCPSNGMSFCVRLSSIGH